MYRHHEHRRVRIAAIAVAAMVMLAACGGDDDAATGAADTADIADGDRQGQASAGGDAAIETTVGVAVTTDPAAVDSTLPTTTTATTEPGSGTYDPGAIEYRVVSLIEEPVDVYVRTTGLIEAFEARLGVEPREITELFAPPDDGSLIITTAGTGDPECVVGCDHFIASISSFESRSTVHTVLLYDETGEVEAFDLWEEPAADETMGNALVASDPTTGQVVVVAVDVTGADFGMWLGFAGVDGCAMSENLSDNILVGGNQTPAYAYDGDAAEVLLYDRDDLECAQQPVGGPFTIEGGPGSRTLLLLTGSPGELDALVVPFVRSDEATATDDADEDASARERDMAVMPMAEEIDTEVGLDAAETATQELAFGGVLDGVAACGIDPDALGR